MNIPQSFKDIQKKVFQDKTIQHYTKVFTTDSEGHRIDGTPTLVATYTVNAQVLSDKVEAEAWGLEVTRDIRITSSDGALTIARNDLVKWNDVFYEVIGDDSRDAYQALYCQKYGG